MFVGVEGAFSNFGELGTKTELCVFESIDGV